MRLYIRNRFLKEEDTKPTKHYILYNKRLSKNKSFEFQISKFNPFYFFEISVAFSRKCDRAGLYIDLSVLGYYVGLTICDTRHWDDEKNTWKTYDKF